MSRMDGTSGSAGLTPGASGGLSRTVTLASADAGLRQRLNVSLSGLRWKVREATGGAEALAQLEELQTEALLLDHWLPDLEVMEFTGRLKTLYPGMDLLRIDGDPVSGCAKSPRRHELLHALREAAGAAQRAIAFPAAEVERVARGGMQSEKEKEKETEAAVVVPAQSVGESMQAGPSRRQQAAVGGSGLSVAIEGLVGESAEMMELARLIRLVAPRSATVLIEGETGTGKEVVARALHRLSLRASKPFVVLNCAAIPEALLEAELFGHTRGAFTGAVQSRTGRIEAAHGGTLFLDEIGEMPMALQAKMLRFLENGELQRVGDNELTRVDVRVVAATHQNLQKRSSEGTFRLDLYHRLAVFPVEVPPLRRRIEDVAALCEHFLAQDGQDRTAQVAVGTGVEDAVRTRLFPGPIVFAQRLQRRCRQRLAQMGRTAPRKSLSAPALKTLCEHDWPGNVRELAHVLERASILAEEAEAIGAEEIRLRRESRT